MLLLDSEGAASGFLLAHIDPMDIMPYDGGAHWARDGLHLSRRGYRAFGARLAERLAPLLRLQQQHVPRVPPASARLLDVSVRAASASCVRLRVQPSRMPSR